MSADPPPDDPFAEGDPEAAAREARRREREQRRKAREGRKGSRRSLADRVSGALGGAGEAEGGERQPSQPAQPPQPPPPERAELPAAARRDMPPDQPPRLGRRPRPEPAPRDPEEHPVRTVTGNFRAWTRGEGTTDPAAVRRRRLLAGGAVLGAIAILALLIGSMGGGEEPVPEAAQVKPVETIDVLVPEGLTIEQIGEVAKDAKLKGNYVKAVENARKDFPLKRYDAADAPSMEGFLFPATYELEKGARAKDLVAKQLEAFEQNFASVNTKRARKKNLNDYDVLKIASLIEKEIQVPEERRLAAAAIYNRLSAGDTLGLDATLRYELENYDEQLLQSELEAATPYNTRLTPGLPPTPIANPGLASLEAAANPADSDVYFFVVKPGTCGEHVFTESQEEFDKASAKYQRALAEEGGSPTEC